MKTTAYTVRALAEGVFEIGEFDCASMFLIEGEDKALLIDGGIGIGDIHGLLKCLTDKPLVFALTHNHGDHIGHAPGFSPVYVSGEDIEGLKAQSHMDLDARKRYAGFIADRSGKTYPYDLDVDMEPIDTTKLAYVAMDDGHAFDLGGRTVTAYLCPGHTKGSMVFLDDRSRILFLGDALNCNLLLGATTVEYALPYLKRLKEMGDRYDRFYNGHSDYRECGKPLDACVLEDAITACEALVSGVYTLTRVKSPLPIFPDRDMMVVGKAMIAFDPERILERNG